MRTLIALLLAAALALPLAGAEHPEVECERADWDAMVLVVFTGVYLVNDDAPELWAETNGRTGLQDERSHCTPDTRLA